MLFIWQKYNGKRSDLGKDAAVLRKVYHSAKAQATSDLQDILEPVRKQPDLEALKVVKGKPIAEVWWLILRKSLSQ